MRKFDKYQQNLSIVYKDNTDWVQSYDTLVAKINWEDRTAELQGWWSSTTSKHINYACKQLGLTVTKKDENDDN